MGSGAAFLDFDQDGRLDIFLLQNAGPKSHSTNKLFRQGADGRFVDVTANSGLDIAGYGMGVAVGDVNNDGWPDIFVTEYGRVRLFLNNGNGTFTDITKEAGLDNPFWGTSAAFVDYDRDGWLDLVIVNYVAYDPALPCAGTDKAPDYCSPQSFPAAASKLYRNLGRAAADKSHRVRFEDVTVKAGLDRAGPGLGVVCADFNGDHWPDILIANDGKPNHLWINQQNGTFKEEAVPRGIACTGRGTDAANMGIAIGDADGDGLFDIFMTHLTEETHTLWKQGPRGMFEDQTVRSGFANADSHSTGFGTLLADFDHDGALDLAIVNGRVKRSTLYLSEAPVRTSAELNPYLRPFADHNQLFVNDGHGRFKNISIDNRAFSEIGRVSRGLACGDVDADGALDLLVTNIGEPARLYRNVAPKRGHWLMVRAVDPALGGRDAYGAEITVTAGGRRWRRWLNPGYSYLCSNDPRAHFGLGQADRVDEIAVLWPDGKEESFPGRATDQLVVLSKGKGQPEPAKVGNGKSDGSITGNDLTTTESYNARSTGH
jgi:hypothetical protein